MAKVDIYQTTTDRVIEAMEAGTMPWQRGWKADASAGMSGMPRRSTGEYYRGINILLLWSAAISKGYNSDQWMTFKQAQEKGACVRKGEKGTKIVFFNFVEKEDKKSGEKSRIPFLKEYAVFNADQIDGLPAMPAAPAPIDTGTESVPELEAFFNATGARIITRGNQPLYRPALDQIEMPAITQFVNAGEYYSTLAHETIHWTGAKSRLDRLGYGKEEYAFEELVAELGALFVGGTIGITQNVANSAAYLNSWLNALRNDKTFIFKAASKAQAATDYLVEKAGAAIPQIEKAA